jgi:hypothetical protein
MGKLHKKLREIQDPEAVDLLHEIATIARLDLEGYQTRMLLHFLQQAFYPNGASERPVPITKEDLDEADPAGSYVLRKKIGKIGDYLFSVCQGVAALQNKGVEDFSGTSLYVFLGKFLVARKSKKKPIRLSQYW